MPNMEWVQPVTELHMAVQEMAYGIQKEHPYCLSNHPARYVNSLTGEFKALSSASVLLDSLNDALFLTEL